jgi:hypothetical protein
MFTMRLTSPGARAKQLAEPMWPGSFELHNGPWRQQATPEASHTTDEALCRAKSENRLAIWEASTHDPA